MTVAPPHAESVLARIEELSVPVPWSGCRLWMGAETEKGYPRVRIGRRLALGHRVVLEAKLGRKLRRNVFACHTCDVRCCVNPDHLFPGTNRTNVKDKVSKGRQARVHRAVVLDFNKAEEIRAACEAGEPVRAVARRVGISDRQVQHILAGRRWPRPRPESEAAE